MGVINDIDVTVASKDLPPVGSGSGSRNPLHDPASHTVTTDVVGPPRDNSHVSLPDGIAGYTITRKIGGGGQGVVFQAIQNSTRQKVALKILPSSGLHDERARMRIEREAQILGQINHPNVVRVHDSGNAAGCVFFAMDYIAGERTLDRYLREKKLDQRQMLDLFARICDGVNAAHLRGVIHRDLKPSNVLVDSAGAPHIVDFGLARLAVGDINMSQTGQFLGSAPWASPEQARGIPDGLDVRTDVYSLGVMLYHMLTGKHPYDVSGPLPDVLNRILHEEPARASTIIRRIDNELDTIINKCLAKEPQRRYQSAGELARDLRHYLNDEPIEAKRDSALYLITKSLKRYRVPVMVAGAFVALLAVFAVLMTFAFNRANEQAERAERTATFLSDVLTSVDPEDARASTGTPLYAALRASLDQAAASIEKMAPDAKTEALLRQSLGRLFMNLGEFSQALDHLSLGVELARNAFGEMDAVTATTLNLLAWAEKEEDRFSEAARDYASALTINEALFGRRSLPVAETLNGMGQLEFVQENYDAAIALLRESLAIRQDARAPERDIASSKANLGSAYRQAERLDEAGPLLQAALEERRRLFGTDHPHTVVSMNKYGLWLIKTGQNTEAVSLLSDALAARKRVMPPNHPMIGVSHSVLAEALVATGEKENQQVAVQHCHAALDIFLQAKSGNMDYFVRTGERLLQAVDGDPKQTLAAQGKINEVAEVLKQRGQTDIAASLRQLLTPAE